MYIIIKYSYFIHTTDVFSFKNDPFIARSNYKNAVSRALSETLPLLFFLKKTAGKFGRYIENL